jgi:hypothetical protein
MARSWLRQTLGSARYARVRRVRSSLRPSLHPRPSPRSLERALQCRSQDSNLGTTKDWILSPAPLTSLGYSCAARARRHRVMTEPARGSSARTERAPPHGTSALPEAAADGGRCRGGAAPPAFSEHRIGSSRAAKRCATTTRFGRLVVLGPVVAAQLGAGPVAAGRARLLLQVVGVPAAAAAGDVRAAAAALGGGSGSHGTHVGRWARAGRATRGWVMMVAGNWQTPVDRVGQALKMVLGLLRCLAFLGAPGPASRARSGASPFVAAGAGVPSVVGGRHGPASGQDDVKPTDAAAGRNCRPPRRPGSLGVHPHTDVGRRPRAASRGKSWVRPQATRILTVALPGEASKGVRGTAGPPAGG